MSTIKLPGNSVTALTRYITIRNLNTITTVATTKYRYIARQRRQNGEIFIFLSHDTKQLMETDFGHIYANFPEGRC